jgi:hypothetical protein
VTGKDFQILSFKIERLDDFAVGLENMSDSSVLGQTYGTRTPMTPRGIKQIALISCMLEFSFPFPF